MTRNPTIGERALDTVHEGLEKGREIMDLAISQGQHTMTQGRRAVSEMLQPRPRRRTGDRWLWLAAGAVGAVAAMTGWRRSGGVIPGFGGRCVGDVMVRSVQTIDAGMNLTQAAQRMRDYNVGVLPVIDGGQLKGIVTDRDLVVRGMASGADPSSIHVGECATHSLIAARPDWLLPRAMETMAAHQIGRLPVVDEADRVIGIVTLGSLALRAPQRHETLDTAKEVSRRSARAV